MKVKHYLAVAIAFLLCSCSVMSPVKLPPESSYLLNQTPDQLPKKQKRAGNILVLLPETNPAYNTTQIAYTVTPYQIAYYGMNHWAATPAQMLQPLIVQTLQKAGYFNAILMPPLLGRYDYVLSTRIMKLQVDFTRQPAALELVLRAQLSRINEGQYVRTKEISITEPLSQNNPYSAVVAANRAASAALAKLAVFAVSGK